MEASVNIFNNNTGRLKNEKVSITIKMLQTGMYTTEYTESKEKSPYS